MRWASWFGWIYLNIFALWNELDTLKTWFSIIFIKDQFTE